MSNEGFKFQASVKDADGDMVNVRADSATELEANLLDFPVAAYAQFKANVRGGSALGQIVQPQTVAAPATPAPVQQQQQPAGWGNSAPAAAPQWSGAQQQAAPSGPVNGSPHPENRGCSGCGSVLQYKAFNSKAGKALKMWACPQQRSKGDGHETVWVD